MRNKIARVDLLTNGFGFVINVIDLDDSINYLHKNLYHFAEKEIKRRMDTCNYLFEMHKGRISTQEKEIQGLKIQIQQL